MADVDVVVFDSTTDELENVVVGRAVVDVGLVEVVSGFGVGVGVGFSFVVVGSGFGVVGFGAPEPIFQEPQIWPRSSDAK